MKTERGKLSPKMERQPIQLFILRFKEYKITLCNILTDVDWLVAGGLTP